MATPTNSRTRKLLAEFAGTFFIALAATGTAAFLGNMPLGISLAYGLAYAAAVGALGHISGGHFNPAVTVAHWVTHLLGTFTALAYIGAQLAGATAAAYAVRFAWVSTTTASPSLLGPPILASGLSRGPALLIEAAMTFALVLALWATIATRARPSYWLGGIVAGTVVAAASSLGAPYTGGAMNPALAFGPALAARQWGYQGVYWVGPLAGAVAAASLYGLLFRRAARAATEVPRQAGN